MQPGVKPLLLWGELDRLPASDVRAARKLHAALSGSQLALVPAAGHLLQLENPGAFIDALLPFLEGPGASRGGAG